MSLEQRRQSSRVVCAHRQAPSRGRRFAHTSLNARQGPNDGYAWRPSTARRLGLRDCVEILVAAQEDLVAHQRR
jgi:hypothetical protein